MTAKEKSRELVSRFVSFKIDGKPMMFGLKLSKELALICVDEILNNPKNDMRGLAEALHDEYWEKVKTEIEKLWAN